MILRTIIIYEVCRTAAWRVDLASEGCSSVRPVKRPTKTSRRHDKPVSASELLFSEEVAARTWSRPTSQAGVHHGHGNVLVRNTASNRFISSSTRGHLRSTTRRQVNVWCGLSEARRGLIRHAVPCPKPSIPSCRGVHEEKAPDC